MVSRSTVCLLSIRLLSVSRLCVSRLCVSLLSIGLMPVGLLSVSIGSWSSVGLLPIRAMCLLSIDLFCNRCGRCSLGLLSCVLKSEGNSTNFAKLTLRGAGLRNSRLCSSAGCSTQMESSTSGDGMHQNAALVLRLDLSGGLTEGTADARVDCTTNV